MMNGEVASFQVGRRPCTYVKAGNSWVSIVLNVANWIEFLIAGVPTKPGGVWRVLIKFGNGASRSRFTLCIQSVRKSSWCIWLESGTCFGKLHQNGFSGDFREGNWHAQSVISGHRTLILADEALVKRDRDPCPEKGQDSVIVA